MKYLSAIILFFFFVNLLYSQAPGAFSYQAVARDADGAIIANENVTLEIEVIKNAIDGESVYKESHSLTTPSSGIISVYVGKGSVLSGNFNSIDWSTGSYFLKTYFNGIEMGTSQIMSVPYALYAQHAETVEKESQVLSLEGNILSISGGNSIELPIETSKQSILITGTMTNEEVAEQLQNELGPNTSVIEINSTVGVTSLNISGKSELYELKIINNKNLTSITIAGVQSVGELSIEGNTSLVNISVDGLTTCNGFKLLNTVATSIQIPDLATINVFCTIGNNENVKTLSLPELEICSDLAIINNSVLDSIDIHSIQILKKLHLVTNSSLSSINLDPVLSGFMLNSVQNDFSVNMVDYFLQRAVSLPDAEVKEISISDFPPVPPSAEGQNNVAILESRGYNVNVDE